MSATAFTTFTRGDLWRGALHAWIAFMVLMEVALIIAACVSDAVASGASSAVAYLPAVVLYSLMIGGVVSAAVTIACVPLAALLGLAMRSVRSLALHILAFAALGAVVGGVVVLIVVTLTQGSHLVGVTALVTMLICALATGYGRWRAQSRRRSTLLRSDSPDRAAV